MAASGFRGTSVEQDGRWNKAEEKVMAEMTKKGKFAAILDTKINPKKINLDVMSKWITQKIIQIVKMEDEVLINMVINMLHDPEVDGKRTQVLLTTFLDNDTPKFMEDLWGLLVDAQSHPSGIPTIFIEQKKQEIQSRVAPSEVVRTIRPNLDNRPVPSTPTRGGSPPGRLSTRVTPNTSPPSIRSMRGTEEERSKRAESRSARIHRPREQAPVEHREDEVDRQRARSRRHGLDERSQSTKKRPLEEEREEEKPRQRYPSRHHDRDRRERVDAVRARRSPPKDI